MRRGSPARRAQWDPGTEVPRLEGVRGPRGAWQGPRSWTGIETGGLAGGNREFQRTEGRSWSRALGTGDAPKQRRTGPRAPPPLHPVACGRTGRPRLPSAPRRTGWPDLSSLAVITPSSFGMSSAAVTASWCPSILLSSTGRLLCGLEWISAAMFARRQPPGAGGPSADRGAGGAGESAGLPRLRGLVGAALP